MSLEPLSISEFLQSITSGTEGETEKEQNLKSKIDFYLFFVFDENRKKLDYKDHTVTSNSNVFITPTIFTF